jgi:FdhE protein
MRQGEIASAGKWTGNPHGGVTAPEPFILPDPASRFGKTAARLEAAAAGHPMQEWLRFMARLSRAQQGVANTMPPPAGIPPEWVAQSVAAGMPPLAADGHRRNAAWQDGLALLLQNLESEDSPPAATAAMACLHGMSPAAVDALADGFLRGTVDSRDTGKALYVTAALQVWFTRLAATLPGASLRLLHQRGLCPCCGSTPVSAVVTASGRTPGARYLHCSLCSTAWNYVRAICITCGSSRMVSLREIEGGTGAVKAETCGECGTYAKVLYQARDMDLDPLADDLASLGLDLLLAEAGFARHAPNPYVLVG